MFEIENYSQRLLNEAIRMNVTDLHFIPSEDEYNVMYRLNGKVEKWKRLQSHLAERLISHFKYRSGLDIGERRKPQSSSVMHIENNQTYSLRFSTLPSKNFESLAIRILPHFSTQTISSLTILQTHSNLIKSITNFSQGLCLITGPTGSGKTTTLYTIIEEMLRIGGKSIITIEDPVERSIPNLVQVEVNSKTGLSFNSVLTACLRHDPDVILIGEIRDEATAAIAIRASLTGHVVLATVHAQNCNTALMRMMDLGVSRFDLLECCKLVLSQRIINIKCPLCQERCHPLCRGVRQRARAALFDGLSGAKLKNAVLNNSSINEKPFSKAVNKAWALGFIEDVEWQRVINENV